MKKVIIIGVIVLLAAAVAFGGYQYFKTRTSDQGDAPPPPTGIENALTPVSDQPVISYWNQGESLYLVLEDGRIARHEGGTETFISGQVVPDMRSALVSPSRSHVLASFGPGHAPIFSIFEVATSRWSPLPPGTVAATWNPTGSEIAYIVEGSSGSTLSSLVVSSLKKTDLLRLSGGDYSLTWVIRDRIYLLDKPSAIYQVAAWSFDVARRTLSPLRAPAEGLTMKWTPSGTAALTFVNSVEENRLSLTNSTGGLIDSLPFVTLPEKCTFSGGDVSGFCAIPEEIPGGTLLPDDYFTNTVHFSDRIVSWTQGGTPVTIYEARDVAIDARELTVLPGAKKIRFINRYDKKVYEIPLP